MIKKDFTIKLKLIIYAATVISIMCLLGIVFNNTINEMSLNKSTSDEFKSVWIKTLELRKSEKDFMLREGTNMDFFESGESKYVAQIDTNVHEAVTLLKELKQTTIVQENKINIDEIINLFSDYNTNFKKIVAAKFKRGELDYGLIGEMRRAIKAVEAEVNDNAAITIQVLTLRRYEKDYFIRKDLSYAAEHEKVISTLLANSSVAPALKEKLTAYSNSFKNIVKIDSLIGFTPKEGIEGEIRAVVHKVEPAIDEITKTLNQALEDDNQKSMITLISLIVIGVIVSFLISFYLIRSITKSLKHAVETVGRIADGDLDFEIKNESRDEIGQLLEKMSFMTSKLKEIISSIMQASSNIASASSQMSTSAQQMSEGATEQASSAEEISSSMEEMAANIQQNTTNAKQTEKIAGNAAKEIIDSNDAVTKTVSSMKTIADKISIIEEISRQTNLLALNAAVEAARAGEHGRGFAVVAAEVRKLAERSQTAAIEINEVSSKSVDVAQRSGELLNNVVPDIQKTSELIHEISAASIEQNIGAEQVNSAIQQLNQVVQENAAIAEEMASGAEELNAQAETLKDIISFFKTGDHRTQHVYENSTVKSNRVKTNTVKQAAPIQRATKPQAPTRFVALNHQDEELFDKAYEKF